MGKILSGARIFWIINALSVAAGSGNACAFDVLRAETRYQDREYRLELEVMLNAPATRVEAVLRDYASYPKLDGNILEATVLSRPDAASVMLYTKLRACSGLFCRTVKRIERVHESALELNAVVMPEQSEVVAGHTHTELQALDGRTRVRYQTSVTPKFWVPSFIGRPLMLRTLREASIDMFRHVEARAKQ